MTAGDRRAGAARATTEQQIDAGGLGSPRPSTRATRTPPSQPSTRSWRARPKAAAAGAGRRRPEDRRACAPTTAARRGVGTDYAQAPAPAGLVDQALRAGHGPREGHQRRRPGVTGARRRPSRTATRRCATPAGQCPACTLKEAITQSLNTTFYGLAFEVGPEKVADGPRGRRAARRLAGRVARRARRRSPSPPRQDAAPRSGSASTRCAHRPGASGSRPSPRGGIYRDPYFVAQGRRRRRHGAARVDRPTPASRRVRRRRQRRHLRAGGRRRLLASARWTAAARWPARPAPQGLDDDGQLRRLDGGLHPVDLHGRVDGHRRPTDPIINARRPDHLRLGPAGRIWQQFMNAVLRARPRRMLPAGRIKGDVQSHGGTGETRGCRQPTTRARRPRPRSRPSRPTTSTAAGDDRHRGGPAAPGDRRRAATGRRRRGPDRRAAAPAVSPALTGPASRQAH